MSATSKVQIKTTGASKTVATKEATVARAVTDMDLSMATMVAKADMVIKAIMVLHHRAE